MKLSSGQMQSIAIALSEVAANTIRGEAKKIAPVIAEWLQNESEKFDDRIKDWTDQVQVNIDESEEALVRRLEDVKAGLDARAAHIEKDWTAFVEEVASRVQSTLTTIEVVTPEAPVVSIKNSHPAMAQFMTCLAQGIPVLLVGPAGTGKTTAAKIAADALGLRMRQLSLCKQTPEYKFLGYHLHGTGEFVETGLYECYSKGGLFLADEGDAANANVLAVVNSLIEQDYAEFACGRVDRHPDFRFVMTANTYGTGSTHEYVGRNKLDAATLDRFAFVDWGFNRDYVASYCGESEWLIKVDTLRTVISRAQVTMLVTPRAVRNGLKLLKAGIPEHQVTKMLIVKGTPSSVIDAVRNTAAEGEVLPDGF